MLKNLNIGFLDRRITIQQQDNSKATDGLPLPTWSNKFTGTVPAKRDYHKGGTSEEDGQEVSNQKATYTTKYASGIDTTCRIIDDGKIYEIEAVEEIGRRQGLLIHCNYHGEEQ